MPVTISNERPGPIGKYSYGAEPRLQLRGRHFVLGQNLLVATGTCPVRQTLSSYVLSDQILLAITVQAFLRHGKRFCSLD